MYSNLQDKAVWISAEIKGNASNFFWHRNRDTTELYPSPANIKM